jgi:inorganic pyrophosphatase
MNLSEIKFGNLEAFNVLVEIPEGSNLKYEFDELSGEMKVNFVFKNLAFPFSYGFIPHTLGGDGDALDAIVLSSAPIASGTVITCKAVGVMQTIDRGERDDKFVVVPLKDALAEKYNDILDLPPGSLKKWTDFYAEVAKQKEKVIEFIGLKNRQTALEEIKKSIL